MTAVITWYQPGGGTTDLSERVDNGGQERFSVTAMAEECSVGTSTIVARDPEGTFEPVGLNAFSIEETDSTGDDPFIWVGRMGQREQFRGRYVVGASRDIEIELQDMNAIPSNYIVGDTENGARSEESHATRIAWAAANIANIDDTSLILITSSVTMPEMDYTGMTWQQVIEDCCRASGYQAFVWFNGVSEEFGLVYAHAAGDWLTTDIRVSNVESEVDEVTTFALSTDARMSIDPSRVASRVFGRGDGVDGFRTNSATEVLHARRDVAMDFATVKTLAVLNARMDRALLNDLDEEEYILRGFIELPSTLASQFKAGHRFQAHATHLSGIQSGFTWMRLLQTTHILLTPTRYRIEFEAEPLGPAVEPSSCAAGATPSGDYGPTHSPEADSDAVVYYIRAGDAQPFEPDPGYTGNPNFPEYGAGGSPDFMGDCAENTVRVMVVGAGTLEVSTATYSGSQRNITASLQHFDEVTAAPSFDDVQAGQTGDSFTFDVSTHDGARCVHWVDINDDGNICGGKFGFAGATWTSLE